METFAGEDNKAELHAPRPLTSGQNAVFTFACADKIHIGNADRINSSIEPALNDSSVRVIVMDLENVRVCDSYGLRLLVSLHRQADRLNKRLVLLLPHTMVCELMEKAGLLEVFNIARSHQELLGELDNITS